MYGEVARSAGGALSSPFMGRWREAPEGLVGQDSSPFMGRWPEGPEGLAELARTILSTPMDPVSPLRLTEYSHGAG